MTKNEKVATVVRKEPVADRATAIRVTVWIILIVLAVAIVLMNLAPALGWTISAF